LANQITDNRSVLFDADSVTNDNGSSGTGRWDTLGSTSETLDTDVKIEGTGSIGEQFTDGLRTLIWDNGSTIDLSNTHLYIWVNCGIVGLLDTKAAGGFRVRLTGPSNANFVEWYVGGSDSWPTAIEGGWVMFVVDTAASTSNTGGTPPALTAIQGVGIAGVTASVMTKVSDNTWIDAGWSLAASTPGIIVEGRNAGSTDWNSADILTQLGNSAGMFVEAAGGAYKINAPIQFGISDTTTHGFSDTNAIWLWDDQEFVAADHYGMSALGNSGGTTRVNFGVKTGSGATATGAQGLVVSAASAGVRWFMDFDDPDLDDIGFWGCSFLHGATFDWDDVAVDVASTLMIDGDKCHVSNANIVRAQVIAPNTADGVAYMDTDDIGDVINCTFEFSDGHGLEILSGGPSSQSNIGNIFLGAYGGTPGDNNTPSSGSNDAMIYNNAAAARTFNRSGGGTQPSFRNGASATSDDVAAISLTFTPLEANSEVRLYETGTNVEIDGVENSGASFVASAGASQALDYKIINPGFLEINIKNVSFATSQNVIVNQQVDRNYIEDAA
jgi:hypothetical protein